MKILLPQKFEITLKNEDFESIMYLRLSNSANYVFFNDSAKIIRKEMLLSNEMREKELFLPLLQGFEKETEEDVGGKQDEGEDDGAAQAAPGGHAFLFLFL